MRFLLCCALVTVLWASSGCVAMRPISTDEYTLTDQQSGTMWVRRISTEVHTPRIVKIDGAIDKKYDIKQNYQKAKEVIQGLNRENYAGFSDWRLPTVAEMRRLIEIADTVMEQDRQGQAKTKRHQPAKSVGLAAVGYFTSGGPCWTSDAASDEDMWVVSLGRGDFAPQKRSVTSPTAIVCPVRSVGTAQAQIK